MWAMDRFVPMNDHSHGMSRHLRAVPDAPQGASYVIGRSVHVNPGTPYVIAKCIDRAVAAVFALAGQQVRSREEMLRDPALAEALRRWDADDASVFQTERKARAAIARPDSRDPNTLTEVRWHPSRTGNART